MKKALLLLLLASQVSLSAVQAQETTTSQDQTTIAETTQVEGTEADTASFDWTPYTEDIITQSGGIVSFNPLFESSEPIVVENDKAAFSIDAYTYLELNNTQSNQTGHVVFLQVTYTNKSDQTIDVQPTLYGSIVGVDSAVSSEVEGFSDEFNLFSLVMDKDRILEPGESLTGGLVFAFPEEQNEALLAAGQLVVESPVVLPNAEASLADAILASENLILPISEDAATKASAQGEFYPDRVTVDVWGDKAMIESDTPGQAVNVGDVEVVLEGYQWTDFTPNDDRADRFVDFKDGVVLLTAEVRVKNNSDTNIRYGSTTGLLTLNDSIRYMNEIMLEEGDTNVVIKKGEEGVHYLVFALSKDDFNLYQDRSAVLEVNLINESFSKHNASGDYVFTIREAE
ncbi:TPA: hypothetical protein ACGO1T_001450 [Streptococcus suis]